jgi:hypothetical protein
MRSHGAYGRKVLSAAAGDAFLCGGPSVEVDYGSGRAARIDGTVSDIAVEVESRTSKQVRGAVLDLVCHRFPKKLLVLVPVHMFDPPTCAEQCRNALARFIELKNFRVVVLHGRGGLEALSQDVDLVRAALIDLGLNEPSNLPLQRTGFAGR